MNIGYYFCFCFVFALYLVIYASLKQIVGKSKGHTPGSRWIHDKMRT